MLNLTPNFTKGRELDRISIFRGGYLERKGEHFQEVHSFYIKSKLNSEIFDHKKHL